MWRRRELHRDRVYSLAGTGRVRKREATSAAVFAVDLGVLLRPTAKRAWI